MNQVFTELVVKLAGPGRWVLRKPLKYAPGDQKHVLVPAGFETDLASVPKALHGVLSPAGKYARAAVLHDWLYVTSLPRTDKVRKAADRMFLKAMREEGVRWLARWVMYRAVRRFGGVVFYRRNEEG